MIYHHQQLILTKVNWSQDWQQAANRVLPGVQASANGILALFAIVIVISLFFRR
jgi:hypothetical protein